MDSQEIDNRFLGHPQSQTPQRIAKYTDLRQGFAILGHMVNELCPDSREKSLAVTALEEALMWANKSIAIQPQVTDEG